MNKNEDNKRAGDVRSSDWLGSKSGDNGLKLFSAKPDASFTFATFVRQLPLDTDHGDFARGAVSVSLNLAIRKPTKKDAARFCKLFGNGRLLKFALKANKLLFKSLIHLLKLPVFAFELFDIIISEKQALSNDSGASVFIDGLFKKVERIKCHASGKLEPNDEAERTAIAETARQPEV